MSRSVPEDPGVFETPGTPPVILLLIWLKLVSITCNFDRTNDMMDQAVNHIMPQFPHLFMKKHIHSLSRYLLSAFFVLGIVVGDGRHSREQKRY